MGAFNLCYPSLKFKTTQTDAATPGKMTACIHNYVGVVERYLRSPPSSLGMLGEKVVPILSSPHGVDNKDDR